METTLSHRYKNKIFISYSRLDSKKVLRIKDWLEKCGCDLWIDREDILPASSFVDDITHALNMCDMVIVFISRNTVDHYHVNREIQFAIVYKKRIISVYLDPCDPPENIKNIQGIRLFYCAEAAIKQLRDICCPSSTSTIAPPLFGFFDDPPPLVCPEKNPFSLDHPSVDVKIPGITPRRDWLKKNNCFETDSGNSQFKNCQPLANGYGSLTYKADLFSHNNDHETVIVKVLAPWGHFETGKLKVHEYGFIETKDGVADALRISFIENNKMEGLVNLRDHHPGVRFGHFIRRIDEKSGNRFLCGMVMKHVEGYPLFSKELGDASRGANPVLILDSLMTTVGILHANNICHLDIKPKNVLFLKDKINNPYLVDLGFARNNQTPTRYLSIFSPLNPDGDEITTDLYGLAMTLLFYISPESHWNLLKARWGAVAAMGGAVQNIEEWHTFLDDSVSNLLTDYPRFTDGIKMALGVNSERFNTIRDWRDWMECKVREKKQPGLNTSGFLSSRGKSDPDNSEDNLSSVKETERPSEKEPPEFRPRKRLNPQEIWDRNISLESNIWNSEEGTEGETSGGMNNPFPRGSFFDALSSSDRIVTSDLDEYDDNGEKVSGGGMWGPDVICPVHKTPKEENKNLWDPLDGVFPVLHQGESSLETRDDLPGNFFLDSSDTGEIDQPIPQEPVKDKGKVSAAEIWNTAEVIFPSVVQGQWPMFFSSTDWKPVDTHRERNGKPMDDEDKP
ncbi:MAG: TIR domain-containing protein [Nitrospirae bacterium]|nr:TIR domain-containing protein [Magnetococcales bacterium]HAT50519.1 hypothetical protein [Alphaproteobacteria bacterium]